MNNVTSNHKIPVREYSDDLELRELEPSAIDTAFLWLIRISIIAIICFTISAIVHDAYLMSVIGTLHG